jgi:hypothetical protein
MLWGGLAGLWLEDAGTEMADLNRFRGGPWAWLETDSDRDREGGCKEGGS